LPANIDEQKQAIDHEATALEHDVVWRDLGDDVWRATCARCGITMVVYGSGSVYGYNDLISEACTGHQPNTSS
jgi:hypothetical protein